AAILASNSPEWTIADAGCQLAGVVDVPIYTTLAPDQVGYILNDSEARILFIENEAAYSRVREALDACPTLEKIIVFHQSSDEEITLSLAELEELGKATKSRDAEAPVRLGRDTTSDDLATLIYTSGTTGEPKGVMLTHGNLVSNVHDASELHGFEGTDTSLSVLPLSHVFERTGMYVYLRFGMRVYFAESIDKAAENLKEVRPTILIGVPRIFEKVLEKARLAALEGGRVKVGIFDWAVDVARQYAKHISTAQSVPVAVAAKHAFADKLVYSKFREFFGGRLRHCITGGAALPDDIHLIFIGAGVSIMQGYGLTETSPVITTNTPEAVKVGTVGRPIRNVEVRIADDGEIEARGPGVMRGYYKRDEANGEAFTADGWFRTGDIGHLDEDGYLVITDRKKELSKTSGGKYIAPAHIEQMLRASKFISQAVLLGNHRKFPAALIVPDFQMLESYAQLKGLECKTLAEMCSNERVLDLISRQIDQATTGLAQFEKVKKFALLDRELSVYRGELTPTLKIKRRVIDERYRDVIDGLYRDA
ncbi:MAG: long-chain fatty acid--CoA ligase, partial [Acidobacteria bacterium]|nr:long-chain fatty acid--CoA ligase [Acidobacteriota bacterium]